MVDSTNRCLDYVDFQNYILLYRLCNFHKQLRHKNLQKGKKWFGDHLFVFRFRKSLDILKILEKSKKKK